MRPTLCAKVSLDLTELTMRWNPSCIYEARARGRTAGARGPQPFLQLFCLCCAWEIRTTTPRRQLAQPRRPSPRPAHCAPPRRGTGWYIRAEWPGPGQSAEAARDRGFPVGPAGRSCHSQKPPLRAPRPGPPLACPAGAHPTLPGPRRPANPRSRAALPLALSWVWQTGSGGNRVRAGNAQPRKARSGVRAGCSARARRRDALAAVRGAPGDPPGSRGRSRARERGLWAPQPVRSPRSPRVPSAEAGASSSALGDVCGPGRGAPDPPTWITWCASAGLGGSIRGLIHSPRLSRRSPRGKSPCPSGEGLPWSRRPRPSASPSLPTSRGSEVKILFSCRWDLLGGHFGRPSVSRRSWSPGSRWSAPTLGVLGCRPAARRAPSRAAGCPAGPSPAWARLGVLGAPGSPCTYLFAWAPSGARYFGSGAARVSSWRLATGDPECDWGAVLGKGDWAESPSPPGVGDRGVSGCPWSALLQGPDRPSGRRRYGVGRFLNVWEVAGIGSRASPCRVPPHPSPNVFMEEVSWPTWGGG